MKLAFCVFVWKCIKGMCLYKMYKRDNTLKSISSFWAYVLYVNVFIFPHFNDSFNVLFIERGKLKSTMIMIYWLHYKSLILYFCILRLFYWVYINLRMLYFLLKFKNLSLYYDYLYLYKVFFVLISILSHILIYSQQLSFC